MIFFCGSVYFDQQVQPRSLVEPLLRNPGIEIYRNRSILTACNVDNILGHTVLAGQLILTMSIYQILLKSVE
jgi:hypothetical protein